MSGFGVYAGRLWYLCFDVRRMRAWVLDKKAGQYYSCVILQAKEVSEGSLEDIDCPLVCVL